MYPSQNYEILKIIGQGTFGKVYLVQPKYTHSHHHNSNNKHSNRHPHLWNQPSCRKQEMNSISSPCPLYVMKEIPIGHLSKKAQQSSVAEATILSQMQHINVCKYIESYLLDGKTNHQQHDHHHQNTSHLYIVMEYADGGDLQQEIQKRKKVGNDGGALFEEHQVMSIMTQCCHGLNHIHEQNILHRDLKSQNIFLTRNGVIKIGDFGIAKVLDSTLDAAKTQVGTPYYFSPEICNGTNYTKSSDVWSLGCILYEVMQLEIPFQADNIVTLVQRILSTQPKPIRSCYNQWLRDSVEAMMEKEPTKRPPIRVIIKSDQFQMYDHVSHNDDIQNDDIHEMKKCMKGNKEKKQWYHENENGNHSDKENLFDDHKKRQETEDQFYCKPNTTVLPVESCDIGRDNEQRKYKLTGRFECNHTLMSNQHGHLIKNKSAYQTKNQNVWEARRQATTRALSIKNKIQNKSAFFRPLSKISPSCELMGKMNADKTSMKSREYEIDKNNWKTQNGNDSKNYFPAARKKIDNKDENTAQKLQQRFEKNNGGISQEKNNRKLSKGVHSEIQQHSKKFVSYNRKINDTEKDHDNDDFPDGRICTLEKKEHGGVIQLGPRVEQHEKIKEKNSILNPPNSSNLFSLDSKRSSSNTSLNIPTEIRKEMTSAGGKRNPSQTMKLSKVLESIHKMNKDLSSITNMKNVKRKQRDSLDNKNIK